MSKGGVARFSEEWLAQRLKATAVEQPAPPKASKYRSHKIEVDGVRFDSKAEAARWHELKLMEKAGLISDLQLQVPFELIPARRKLNGKIEHSCTYIADFVYFENGIRTVEDVKGMPTKEYIVKRKLMFFIHGIEIREFHK